MIKTETVLACYQQAQAITQGVLTNTVVLNEAVFPHWIDNTHCFWYKQETREGKTYRLVDAKAGDNQSALDHQALAAALGTQLSQSIDHQDLPITVTDIALSPRQIYFKAFDKSWVFDAEKTTCQEIEPIPTVDGLCSPDGKKMAFVRDYNLWVRNSDSGEERALTQDGTADFTYACAAAPFGAASPAVQAVWSPDSQQLLTHRLDLRHVTARALIQHVPQAGGLRPQPLDYQSTYPGDKTGETFCLLVIQVDTGEIRTANYEPLPLCRFGAGFFSEEKFGWWANDNRRVFFIDVARGAKIVSVVEFDTQSGETRCLFEETSTTFVKLSHSILERPLFLPLPESNELIWFSERQGWGHLYLYDLNSGQLKHAVTEEESSTTKNKSSKNNQWLVRNILHFDAKQRELLIQTAARDPNISPYYRDICRVNIDTGVLTPLATGDHDHMVYSADNLPVKARGAFGLDSAGVSGISPDGTYLVTTQSRVDRPPTTVLMDREGKNILTVETADPYGLPTDWQWPEPVKLKGADGKTDTYGVVYRPPGFSPDKCYPLLDFSCGHPGYSYVPHGAFINNPFSVSYLEGAAYAALGFVVVAIEGRGSPYRHKAFQDASYGNIVAANAFDDRIAGLRQLAKQYPSMDLDRVGLVGCDGITGPVYGLLQHPEFYKVGVMVALEDSRFNPASMLDMFEGTNPPQKEPYAETLATSLQGRLLLIHGMLDTVTPPTATFRLIDALQHANKNFDLLLLPNDGHHISSYMLRRTWDYLVTHLQGVEPPTAFKLTTAYELLMNAASKKAG